MAKKKKKQKKSYRYSDWLTGAMLTVIVGIVPLVMRLALRPMPSDIIGLFTENIWMFVKVTTYNDLFSYWKLWFLVVSALIIVANFISAIAITGRRLDFKAVFSRPPVIVSSVYFLFVLLSFIFSDFRFTAFHGVFGRSEGILAQAAYITVFIASFYYFRGPEYARFPLYGLIFSSLLMGAISLSQFLQRDLLSTKFASWMILGDWDDSIYHTLSDKFNSTLSNANTFGLYTAMVAPLLLITGFVYDGKKWVNALFLLAGGLMLTGMVASDSLGGFMGISAAAVVLAITYVCSLIRNKKRPSRKVGVIVAAVLAGLLASYLWVGPVNAGINGLMKKFFVNIKSKKTVSPDYIFENGVLNVTDGRGNVIFTIAGGEGDDGVVVLDEDGQPVEPVLYSHSQEERMTLYRYEITSSRYNTTIATQMGSGNGFYYFQKMALSLQDGRIIPHMLNRSPIDTSTPVASWGFKNREHWGSSRGYIWSRTFPLMGKYAVIGSGSDTFIHAYPQHDIVGKLRFFRNPYIKINKAENLYLQTWVTTGGISVLALLFLLGYYLITTFVSLVRSQGEAGFVYGLRLGLLAAVSAFSVSSLSTDSTIGSTGVFYVLLGLGYAANGWVDERQKTEK